MIACAQIWLCWRDNKMNNDDYIRFKKCIKDWSLNDDHLFQSVNQNPLHHDCMCSKLTTDQASPLFWPPCKATQFGGKVKRTIGCDIFFAIYFYISYVRFLQVLTCLRFLISADLSWSRSRFHTLKKIKAGDACFSAETNWQLVVFSSSALI